MCFCGWYWVGWGSWVEWSENCKMCVYVNLMVCDSVMNDFVHLCVQWSEIVLI